MKGRAYSIIKFLSIILQKILKKTEAGVTLKEVHTWLKKRDRCRWSGLPHINYMLKQCNGIVDLEGFTHVRKVVTEL